MEHVTAFRLQLTHASLAVLSVHTIAGQRLDLAFPLEAMRRLSASLKDMLATPSARADPVIEWTPTRYQTAPGPSGAYEVAAVEDGRLAIAFRLPGEHGPIVDLILPPADIAQLIENLRTGLRWLDERDATPQ